MKKLIEIHSDPLFVGLTRVPVVMGVPYAAFIVEVMVAGLINIIVGNPLYMLLVLPIHAVLYLVSIKDPGVFAEIAVWFKTNGRCLNKGFWGAASFSPLETNKWKRDQ